MYICRHCGSDLDNGDIYEHFLSEYCGYSEAAIDAAHDYGWSKTNKKHFDRSIIVQPDQYTICPDCKGRDPFKMDSVNELFLARQNGNIFPGIKTMVDFGLDGRNHVSPTELFHIYKRFTLNQLHTALVNDKLSELTGKDLKRRLSLEKRVLSKKRLPSDQD